MALDLDVKLWAEAQFGNCKLGDARRTKRAVRLAAAFAENPGGSTPERTENWAECKAALTAFLSIVAVRLPQMKLMAPAEPARPAAQLAPLKWLELLSAVRTGKHKKIHTARDFIRA